MYTNIRKSSRLGTLKHDFGVFRGRWLLDPNDQNKCDVVDHLIDPGLSNPVL